MDLASVELNEPLWIAAPHLRELRNRLNCVDGPPLGLTIHVGEDFRHIASGLRAVAEPLVWNMVERGDRLGHALALGLDVKKWAEKNPTIYQPRWERLLDLLYMLDGITRYHIPTPAITLEELRHAIHQILKDLHMPEVTVDSIKCLWEQLGCPDTLRGHLHFPTETTAPQDPPLKLLHRYLWDKETQEKADARIKVQTAPHIDLLTTLQQHLLIDIARWQIAIEVNPSSNLLIYGMEAPLEQPMFRLRPIQQYQSTVVPVALCSDDPISFTTRLADEYAYAWAGLVSGQVAPSYARSWLDEAAATSYRMRFTQALRPQIP